MRPTRPPGRPPRPDRPRDPSRHGSLADGTFAAADPVRVGRHARRQGRRSGATTGCATSGSRAKSAGSRFRAPGHGYFTLKDERSQLACVCFRDDRLASPFEPQTGLRVVAHGRIDVFDAQGVYQLYVSVAAAGRLRRPRAAVRGAQGPARAPKACSTRRASDRCRIGRRSIAVVTSPTGAVWHDIQHGARAALAAGPGRARRRARSRAIRAPASSSRRSTASGAGSSEQYARAGATRPRR